MSNKHDDQGDHDSEEDDPESHTKPENVGIYPALTALIRKGWLANSSTLAASRGGSSGHRNLHPGSLLNGLVDELDLLLTHEVVLRKDRTDRRSASGLLLSLIGDRKTLLGLIFGDSTVGDGNLAEEKILFLTHSFVTCIQPRIKGTYERPKSAAKSCLLNRQEKIRRRCRLKAVLYNRPKEACLYAVQPSGSCRLFHSLD